MGIFRERENGKGSGNGSNGHLDGGYMGENGLGFRVVSPVVETCNKLPQNGNSQELVTARRVKINLIGTTLALEKAEEIAREINSKKSILHRIIPSKKARVIPETGI